MTVAVQHDLGRGYKFSKQNSVMGQGKQRECKQARIKQGSKKGPVLDMKGTI